MATVDFENIVLQLPAAGGGPVSATAYDTVALDEAITLLIKQLKLIVFDQIGIEEYKDLDLSAAGSAAITGTATESITEADIVTGGKTIIITLSGDTWIAN